MRLIRVSSNTNTVIRTWNENTLKFYNNIQTSNSLYNVKPSIEIMDTYNLPTKLDDITNSLQISCNNRPYKIYYLTHEMHVSPSLLFMRHWVDFSEKKIKALCMIDRIAPEQIRYCSNKRNKKMDYEELKFMFILCDIQSKKEML